MSPTREQRVETALFRGASLTLANTAYAEALRGFLDALLQMDAASEDSTVRALGLRDRRGSAAVVAREGGVVAGLTELNFLLGRGGVQVELRKQDGDVVQPDDVLLVAEGTESKLLALERVGLNLLQRMSGIATTSRCLQERLRSRSFPTKVVGTRKTLWGLLDKRALHLGSGGTHRLSLADAILVKNNHLALLRGREEDAAPPAIERAWKRRGDSAFIEVEVRSEAGARAAAQAFRRLRQDGGGDYPCLVMLDNTSPEETGAIIEMLRREDLWDDTLVEASGRISEASLEAYAEAGVDAVSMGALTHSARALDISQKVS